MKNILFALSLIVVGRTMSFAQCSRNVALTASKTEYLDASGTLQKSVVENSRIEITKKELVISPGNEEQKMTGIIKSDTCNWKIPFQEGKTVLKATLSKKGENTMNATVTIEGKEGKLTFLMEVEEMRDRKIRVVIDKFEEKK